jgi:PTS system N-acetylglucosamine-specific IIC component
VPVGLAYFAVYYAVFRLAIVKLDLKTPGREADDVAAAVEGEQERGAAFVAALGGAGNLLEVGACTTRLRLVVGDQAAVSEAALKALGARGLIRPSAQGLQVILGPQADSVASEISRAMAKGPVAVAVPKPVAAETVGLRAVDLAALPIILRQTLGDTAKVWLGHSRLVVECDTEPDLAALKAHGLRGAWHNAGQWHLLFAPETLAAWQ